MGHKVAAGEFAAAAAAFDAVAVVVEDEELEEKTAGVVGVEQIRPRVY